MKHIEYFKLQAKNLFRDFNTRTPHIDNVDGSSYYTYDPKYFNIQSIFFDYEWEDEEDFTLMKAQHLFANILGFKQWADLLNASGTKLELAKLRFDNQHKVSLREWEEHIADLEHETNIAFDDDSELELFKHGLLHNEVHGGFFQDYRLIIPVNRKRCM